VRVGHDIGNLAPSPSRTGVHAEHRLPKGGSTTLTICIGDRRCIGGGRYDVGKCLLP
jgi:hypothetical protein